MEYFIVFDAGAVGIFLLTGKSTSLSFRKKEPDTPLYLQVI